MAVTFRTATTVNPGESYNSEQWNNLANAFNDRISSGLGDTTYRIHQYFFNLWRQVRNPEGAAFPVQSEFFQFYMHLNPALGTWPEQGPGLPAGANLGCHMMGFIYGRGTLLDEVDRLKDVILWSNGNTTPPTTDVERWQVAKLQRGVYDPVAELQNVPALETAQSYFQIEPQFMGSHGRSYGGFPPVPATIGTCANGNPEKQYRFTHIPGTLPDKVYSGNCEEDSGGVRSITRASLAYYVNFFDDTSERLDYKEWIEGPYDVAGDIDKPDANSLSRTFNEFVHDFRGTDSERTPDTDFKIDELGFDFQKFMSKQYFLAPNKATWNGSSLDSEYPLFQWLNSTSHPAGTFATHAQSGTDNHSYYNGFVFAGFYVEQSELLNEVTVSILNDTTILGKVTISPGAAPAIQMIEAPVTPAPLKFVLDDTANFTSTAGHITFECLEILAYYPEMSDCYLVLRLMATDGNDLAPVDGSGEDESTPKNLSDDYFEYGLIYNTSTNSAVKQSVGLNGVNNNPIFDAARRLCRENMREVNRFDLLDYEASGGKSILRFKRYTKALAGLDLDSFIGLAPDASSYSTGELVIGETYIVRSGSIVHNGTTYNTGETFTAVNADYTGSADVRVYEGIRTIALPADVTTEWLFDLDTIAYHESGSSVWKPDAYTDQFFHINRCHFDAPSNELGLVTNRDLYLHFEGDISGGSNVAPNSPSGMNYMPNLNDDFSGITGGNVPDAERDQFFTSCQIYKTPHKVESCISYEDGGIEVVEITLADRLLHNPSAAASYPRDHTLWNATDIANETYRTEENAILEYILDQKAATRCTSKHGDHAAAADVWSDPDNPRGSCYPKLKFTRLVPRVYEDSNATQETTDKLMEARDFLQLEIYLRAICEGFIDGFSSANYGCDQLNKPGLFDYTFENLCLDAFGGRWLNPISNDVRLDNTEGFGPMPNTITYAELFNQLAKSINKLDKVRLNLPVLLECKTDEFQDKVDITPTWNPDGTCAITGTTKVVNEGYAPTAPTTQTITGSWASCGAASALAFSTIDDSCNGSSWVQNERKELVDFRFQLEDPEAINSVPLLWRDMINTSNTGMLAIKTTTVDTPTSQKVFTQAESDGCQSVADGFFWDDIALEGWQFDQDTQETVECVLVNQGQLDPGIAPSGDFYHGLVGGAVCSNLSQRRIVLDPVLGQLASYVQVPLV